MISKKKPFGWIYKISHKHMPNLCYIGSTKVSIEKRFQQHIRDAKKANRSDQSDSKLHTIMWAHKPASFKIKKIDTAKDIKDLSKLENFYIKKFDSVKNGWNKNKAANITQVRTKITTVKIDGVTHKATSKAGLCRELGISNSTVNYWQSRGNTLHFSIKKALFAKKLTNEKESIIVFREKFKDVSELARSKLNKYKLNSSSIRQRIRKGKTYEEALHEKPSKPKEIKIKFKKKTLKFPNATKAYEFLSKEIKDIPTYSSVISTHGKGETWEVSFGIDKPKWRRELSDIENLINNDGYKLTGDLNQQSKPVVDDINKEIFSSRKIFAETYGFEYHSVCDDFKKDMDPTEIIKKRRS